MRHRVGIRLVEELQAIPAAGWFVVTVTALWCLWLLAFVLDAAGARWGGVFFFAVGAFFSLLHRPLGWFNFKTANFKIIRIFRLDLMSWDGFDQQGAQGFYLGLGLALMGVGCICLIRSIF